MSGLIAAAKVGDLERARHALHEAGQRDEDGATALMHAASNGHFDLVNLLFGVEGGLTSGQSYRTEDGCFFPSGSTALMCAAKNGHLSCVTLLAEREEGLHNDAHRTAMMYAAKYGHPKCVEALLSREGGEQTIYGQTALIIATTVNHPHVVKVLLPREGRMTGVWGWSALMKAAHLGHLECAELLLPEVGLRSTRRHQCCPPGVTALMIAAVWNRLDIIHLLLKYEQGLVDMDGHTALWHATHNARLDTGEVLEGGHPDAIRLLQDESDERLPPPAIMPLEDQPIITGDQATLLPDLEALKAELQTERELRLTAEKEVDRLKEELTALKAMHTQAETQSSGDEQLHKNYDLLHSDFQTISRQLARLMTENETLSRELQEARQRQEQQA